MNFVRPGNGVGQANALMPVELARRPVEIEPATETIGSLETLRDNLCSSKWSFP